MNVLLPLLDDPAGLTALLQTIDKDVEKAVAIEDGHVQKPSLVELEWVGGRGCPSLEGTRPTRGHQVTSADAFVAGRLRDGTLRGYLMEWKYVEDGSEKDKNPGLRGDERRRRYGPLFGDVFHPDCQLEDFLFDPVYQLMRLCLLARKIADEEQVKGMRSVRVVLVCPRTNDAYRGTRALGQIRRRLRAVTTIEAVRQNLRDQDGLIDRSPDELLRGARSAPGDPAARAGWLTYMQNRYGW